ncbi:MAG TPA: hypothetical protein VHD56_09125 [Tepidisphaeraceae bacterium]|nr:hypothetical protein [Tepidisphaeraceae bacterium]
MPIITIVLGGLLTFLGIVGFVTTGSQHYTALIPAVAGTFFEMLGGVALNPKMRKHAMHAAAALGLIGFLGTITGVIKLIQWSMGTEPARPAAVVSQAIMCVLCIVFVLLCVRSFIQARRNREAQAQ